MAEVEIPERYRDLLRKPAFAHLATLLPDGSPHVTPMWVDYDGEYFLFNTARGRQKDRNMQRDPHVAFEITDPTNPYRYLLVRGRVEEITEEGAAESIDRLAKKYKGMDRYDGWQPGMVRVIYKIRPERITGS